jgi:hypothetical protein
MPRRMRVPRTPRVKKQKPVKIPRPKTKDLRMILKGLLTVSQANRISSLAYALQWYDQALPYLVQKGLLDATAKQLLERAVKARKLGIGSSNDNEKETAFLTALRQYEKACASLKPMGVDKFYDQFNAKKVQLEAKQKKLEGKFGSVIQLLQKSIGNKVKLQIADAQKAFQYDPGLTSVSYNREAAKSLVVKFRQEGLLSVLVEQLPILAQHAALQSDGKGGWQYDPASHVAVVEEILTAFVQFSKTHEAPKKLVRAGVVRVAKPAVPGQSRAPRGPKGPAQVRPTIDGRVVPGSRQRAVMCAMVYERIKDGQEHVVADVLVDVDTPDRIKQLERYGSLWGAFTVTLNKAKNKVTLKHTAGKP